VSKLTGSINTVLFDWDGTLFDSASGGLTAFQKTFRDLGVAFSLEFYEANYSPNWYTMYEALNIPHDRWRTADELWLRHYGEQPARLVDGGRETILELGRRGYRLGIVTAGSALRVTREINALGLDSLFNVVVTNESTVNKKPHPEGLERAMQLLNATSEFCSYVGDSVEDIEMGRNARVLTVAVPSGYPTSRRLAGANPDIHLESISDLLLHFESGALSPES
jgi:HAD superfamily hydrolase (TIGR01509 family)